MLYHLEKSQKWAFEYRSLAWPYMLMSDSLEKWDNKKNLEPIFMRNSEYAGPGILYYSSAEPVNEDYREPAVTLATGGFIVLGYWDIGALLKELAVVMNSTK